VDHARDLTWDNGAAQAKAPKPSGEGEKSSFAGLDKVLRVALGPKDPVGDIGASGAAHRTLSKRDFSAALDLVRSCADTMKQHQDRAQETEAQTQELMRRAAQELKAAEVRIRSAETRAQAAESRATAAEARAKEAEEWLARIHDTLVEQFGPAAQGELSRSAAQG
jgi:DNA repair exonuclease SbcCD ATPase subunit